MMEKGILECYKTLKECCEGLEGSVKASQSTLSLSVTKKNSLHESLILEKAICYHYKEILKHLTEIKSQIAIIQHHDEKIRNISTKRAVEIEDFKRYSYVQQQIKAFSNVREENEVPMRAKRVERNAQESQKYLDMWETILEEDTTNLEFDVYKRSKPKERKKKKYVSSTFNEFLEEKDEREFNQSDLIVEENDEQEENNPVCLPKLELQENSSEASLKSPFNSYSITDLLTSFAQDRTFLNDSEIDEENIEFELAKPKVIELIPKRQK